MIRPLLTALQFLTRLPVRLDGGPQDRDQSRSLLYYPVVGLVLGVLLAAAAWLLADVPALLRGALLLVFWVGMTGALHLDGLADSVDAWAGGHGARERTLTIMKDPRSGPMGVTAIVLVLLVKFSALVALCEVGELRAIVLAPVLGRTALPLLFLTTPYVRPGGLGSGLAAQLPRRALHWCLIMAAAGILLVGGMIGLVMLLAGTGGFLMARGAMRRRIGGTTGDTAGGLVEFTEATVVVAATVMAAVSVP
jgi:adenosylcobinamide-GDP ribazoletransferase